MVVTFTAVYIIALRPYNLCCRVTESKKQILTVETCSEPIRSGKVAERKGREYLRDGCLFRQRLGSQKCRGRKVKGEGIDLDKNRGEILLLLLNHRLVEL